MSLFAGPDRTEGALRTRTGRVLTWGTLLKEWTLEPLQPRPLRRGPFGEGGCLADLDNDGREEFVSVRGPGLGDLLWMPLGTDLEEKIDAQVEMGDCVAAELFGRRGVLMIHRGAQVRFYERTAPRRWRSRDIYSIYTPSHQRGLALADVNGDGRTDIFCGNYWIEAPERFEHSWRLFAIHTWFEDPDSAALRIAVMSPREVAAGQARVQPARLATFRAPADPRQPWIESRLAHSAGRVRALLYSGGRLIVGGDTGLFIERERITNDAVEAMALLDDQSLFVIGPAGASIVPLPPRR
jgi:hypothetical protein